MWIGEEKHWPHVDNFCTEDYGFLN
jgi:hypothetical protein